MITFTDNNIYVSFLSNGEPLICCKNGAWVTTQNNERVTIYSYGDVLLSAPYTEFSGYGNITDLVNDLTLLFSSNPIVPDEFTLFVGIKTASLEDGTFIYPFNTVQGAIDYYVANNPINNVLRLVHLGGQLNGDFTIPDHIENFIFEGWSNGNSQVIQGSIAPININIEGTTNKFCFFHNLMISGSGGTLINFVGGSNVGMVFNGCYLLNNTTILDGIDLPLFIIANGYVSNGEIYISGNLNGIYKISNVAFDSGLFSMMSSNESTLALDNIKTNIYGTVGLSLQLENVKCVIRDCNLQEISHLGVINTSDTCITAINLIVGDLYNNNINSVSLTNGMYKFYNCVLNLVPNSAVEY